MVAHDDLWLILAKIEQLVGLDLHVNWSTVVKG